MCYNHPEGLQVLLIADSCYVSLVACRSVITLRFFLPQQWHYTFRVVTCTFCVGGYEIFVGHPPCSGGGRCGHYDHPYRNDDSRFAKGITKIIIPSAGGVRLRGLFVMLPTDSTRRRINPRGVLTLAEEKHESVVFCWRGVRLVRG